MSNKRLMIVAGEASGDHYGAGLVRAVKKKSPDVFFFGIGGNELRKAGVEIVVDASLLSVVGITEVFFKLKDIMTAMSAAKQALKREKPDLLILIDYPDFNLHLAGYAKKLGIKVLYYISPTIWAWRSGRIKTIRERVDHMAVIFPFEQSYYHKRKIPATFTGNPLLDKVSIRIDPNFEKRFNSDPVIGLLPGSRDGEIEKILPVMLEAAHILHKGRKNIRFLVSLSPSVKKSHVEDIIQRHQGSAVFELLEGLESIFEQCSFAVAASGTATLETAMAGIPMLVVYKVSPLSYRIGKALIRVSHISLVNLISGKGLVPELIQDNASPENIADIVSNMLDNTAELIRIRRELLNIRSLMGKPGASERVADIALNMIAG